MNSLVCDPRPKIFEDQEFWVTPPVNGDRKYRLSIKNHDLSGDCFLTVDNDDFVVRGGDLMMRGYERPPSITEFDEAGIDVQAKSIWLRGREEEIMARLRGYTCGLN